jgi:hypothetical protein
MNRVTDGNAPHELLSSKQTGTHIESAEEGRKIRGPLPVKKPEAIRKAGTK